MFVIWKYQLLRLLRNRKPLMTVFVYMPVVVPAIMLVAIVFLSMISSKDISEGKAHSLGGGTKVGVVEVESDIGNSIISLAGYDSIWVKSEKELRNKIESLELTFGLVVNKNDGNPTPQVRLVYSSQRNYVNDKFIENISESAKEYTQVAREKILNKSFPDHELKELILDPIKYKIDPFGTFNSSLQKIILTAFWLSLVIFPYTVCSRLGSQIMISEFENKTMERIRTTQKSNKEIIFGKWLSLTTLSLLSLVWGFFLFYLYFNLYDMIINFLVNPESGEIISKGPNKEAINLYSVGLLEYVKGFDLEVYASVFWSGLVMSAVSSALIIAISSIAKTVQGVHTLELFSFAPMAWVLFTMQTDTHFEIGFIPIFDALAFMVNSLSHELTYIDFASVFIGSFVFVSVLLFLSYHQVEKRFQTL